MILEWVRAWFARPRHSVTITGACGLCEGYGHVSIPLWADVLQVACPLCDATGFWSEELPGGYPTAERHAW